MFEQKQPTGQMPGQSPTPGAPANPSFNQTPSAEPEDIFAGINTGAPTQMPPTGYNSGMDPEEPKSGAKKAILIVLIVIIVILVIAGGVLAYLSFMTQPQPTTLPNLNVVSNVNAEPIENLNVMINENLNVTNINQETNVNLPVNGETEAQLDSDNDGLSDIEEEQLGTNPFNPDSDNDGLTDFEEVRIYNTNPLIPDTDGDGYLDGEEVRNGYDPAGPGKLLTPPVTP